MGRPAFVSTLLLLVFALAGCGESSKPAAPDPGVWTPTGPEGGSVQALASSATSWFAGTSTGGIFRSMDNGATWTTANQGLLDVDVLSFASRSGAVVAGTANGGVFVSADDGAT